MCVGGCVHAMCVSVCVVCVCVGGGVHICRVYVLCV